MLFICVQTGQDSSYAAFLNDGEVVVEVRYHGFVEWIRKVGAFKQTDTSLLVSINKQ